LLQPALEGAKTGRLVKSIAEGDEATQRGLAIEDCCHTHKDSQRESVNCHYIVTIVHKGALYSRTQRHEDELIHLDLGGGTLDVSLLEVGK